MTLEWGHFWLLAHNLDKLGRGPFCDAKYQISRLWAFIFRQKDFFIIGLKPLTPLGGAFFWSQSHTLSKVGRGLLGDTTYQMTLMFQKEDFLSFHFKNLFLTYIMQITETIQTINEVGHIRIWSKSRGDIL